MTRSRCVLGESSFRRHTRRRCASGSASSLKRLHPCLRPARVAKPRIEHFRHPCSGRRGDCLRSSTRRCFAQEDATGTTAVHSRLGGDLADLREAHVDLNIGALGEQTSDIQPVPLFSQKVVCVVREHHPMLSVPITAKRFAAECHVAARHRGRMSNSIDAALAKMGYRRFVWLTVPSPYAALMAAARCNLVATAPARFASSV